MNEKLDEFGHKVEFTTSDVKDGLLEASNDLEDGYEKAKESFRQKFDRAQFEHKAEARGKKVGKGARNLFEFAGDSIGLMLLKNNGNQDWAYKIIKGGRLLGETAETVLDKVISGGGKVAAGVADKVDIDELRHKADEVADTVKEKVKDSELVSKVDIKGMKTKVEDMFQDVSDKVTQGIDKLKPDPISREQKKADLEAKIEAFEKLYEEEAINIELHPEDLYRPEELKK